MNKNSLVTNDLRITIAPVAQIKLHDFFASPHHELHQRPSVSVQAQLHRSDALVLQDEVHQLPEGGERSQYRSSDNKQIINIGFAHINIGIWSQ